MIVAASNCLTAIQARWIGAIRVVRQKRTGKAVHGRGARFGGERRFTWGIRRYGVCSEVEIKSYVFIKNYHHVLNGVVVAESDCANEAMGATMSVPTGLIHSTEPGRLLKWPSNRAKPPPTTSNC